VEGRVLGTQDLSLMRPIIVVHLRRDAPVQVRGIVRVPGVGLREDYKAPFYGFGARLLDEAVQRASY